MALTLPYPNSPTNGDALDADPVRANIQAIVQAVQSFDGSQIQAGSVAEAALADAINPRLRAADSLSNFVVSGCIWSLVSGLQGTMSAGRVYVNGYRVTVSAVGSHNFTASVDTYVDVDNLGNITYVAVSNGAPSPALTANSLRLGVLVTNGSTITFVNQGQLDITLTSFGPVISGIYLTGFDTNGNALWPQANQKLIGYATGVTNQTGIVSESFLSGFQSTITTNGRQKVKLSAQANVFSSTNGDIGLLRIKEGSTIIKEIRVALNNVTSVNTFGFQYLLPAAGTHAYTLTFARGTGSGTLIVENSASAGILSAELA